MKYLDLNRLISMYGNPYHYKSTHSWISKLPSRVVLVTDENMSGERIIESVKARESSSYRQDVGYVATYIDSSRNNILKKILEALKSSSIQKVLEHENDMIKKELRKIENAKKEIARLRSGDSAKRRDWNKVESFWNKIVREIESSGEAK